MRDFIYPSNKITRSSEDFSCSIYFNRKNRRYKRLIKYDNTHKWIIKNYEITQRGHVNCVTYICVICDYLKQKRYLFNSNSPYYTYENEFYVHNEYNCKPCSQRIMEDILV